MFEDKEIINPMNPEEVFTCNDLVKDWRVCRREWRMETKKNNKIKSCWEYRKIALQCFWKDEDDFVDQLIEQHNEKKKF